MSEVNPEAIACSMLREYLLAYMPLRLADINSARRATVKSATLGPWAISSGQLTLATARGAAGSAVTLPTGPAVSAATIAAAITTAAIGVDAYGDSAGRLVLLSGDDVTSTGSSALVVLPGASNFLFGWPAEGCHDVRGLINEPTWKSVMDGWPVGIPDAKTMSIILGDRDTTPLGGYRRDEYLVTVELAVWNVDAAVTGHRTREAIQACVQCVREVLESDEGRRLGDVTGVIQHVSVGRVRVRGMPFSAFDEQRRLIGPPSDVASMQVQVKVFARPDVAP